MILIIIIVIIIKITRTHDLYGISWWFDNLYFLVCLRQLKLEAVNRLNWKEWRGVVQHLSLPIGILVSDRHRGIAKWIRENCVNTKHYFDIWHVARSLGKKLLALSREKGCEIIKEWMKGIRKHLYWCATSTKAGFESLILATWSSFLRHVSNKHNNHPDPLYKQCCHGQLEPRKWRLS